MITMSGKSKGVDYADFVEVDPSGRYGMYNEILGKGTSKTVYRAFDEYEGTEVAWSELKLHDFLHSPEDLERLYCEIHLLKALRHKNIMKFYTSWVDIRKRNINFITEMFTSGTLRQYRQEHRRVSMKAVKHWCRQILMGLVYLHSHDPPVIHRGLNCDNIFINGNQGEVKIGDLGLAAVLRRPRAAHCLDSPEVYVDEYNKLVDIYSFGLCVLEMFTIEYPCSECVHPSQIYKKGTIPNALYRVKNTEVRRFVKKCLIAASLSLSALELLNDPFLRIDCISPAITAPSFKEQNQELDLGIHHTKILSFQEEHFANLDITIKGRRKEDGGVFLRLRIADKYGRVRNIYFSFDVKADTALSVATEMVAELGIDEYELTRIAEMINGELSVLVPGWKIGPWINNSPSVSSMNVCENCASNVSSHNSLEGYLQSLHCSNLECAAMHGRFEEITYQIEEETHSLEEGEHLYPSNTSAVVISKNEGVEKFGNLNLNSEDQHHQDLLSDHEHEIKDELPWLSAKNLMLQRGNKTGQSDVGREIEIGSSDHRLLQASSERKMKSFHLATNYTFRIPRDQDNL